jgi:FkbM family methyltransferase
MHVLKNGELQIDTRGVSFRVAKVPAFEVGNDLIALRGYLAEAQIRPGNVVVDAGASGSGIATMYFSKVVGDTGKVIALEPDDASFKNLEKNLLLNHATNVIALKKGLWNREETLKFNAGMNQSSSVTFGAEAGAKMVEIACVDLDRLLAELKIPQVDFIKMDIEGAEIEAIAGMKNILQSGKTAFAIASYHVRDGSQTYLELEKSFLQLGYQVHTGHPIHLTTYARKA